MRHTRGRSPSGANGRASELRYCSATWQRGRGAPNATATETHGRTPRRNATARQQGLPEGAPAGVKARRAPRHGDAEMSPRNYRPRHVPEPATILVTHVDGDPALDKEKLMETQTLGIHQGTYDAVFQHPVARNLQWRDVRSMLGALADETEERSGNLKFTRNGETLTVHPPKRKDFSDIQELMQIRHFLERSGAASRTPVVADGVNLLVVIDHREARIFKTELHGSVRSEERRVGKECRSGWSWYEC